MALRAVLFILPLVALIALHAALKLGFGPLGVLLVYSLTGQAMLFALLGVDALRDLRADD